MKTQKRFIGYVALFIFMVTFAACAATSRQESTGDYVDDSVITAKVKSQLATDDFLKSFQIGVETYKGTVQLSGFVDSEQASSRAAALAKSVDGVQSVKNSLVVK